MRGPVNCPKCRREHRPSETACPRCGLLVVKWTAFQPIELTDPVIDAAWKMLEGNWSEAKAHSRFLETAAATDGLAVAAARYRQAREARPDDSQAADGLRRAATMAATLYQMRRGPMVPRNYIALRLLGWISAGVVFLALFWAVRFLFSRGA